MIESPAATAWYVYGVVPAGTAVPDGVRLVEHGPLAAVAAEVPLDEFGEEALRERLNDRAWLEEKARRHEDVLRTFLGAAPVVPLRFGTLYTDADDIRTMLEERSPSFRAALERLRGCVEVGVKAWLDREAIAAPAPATGGGRAYLERRRDELAAARDASARGAEVAVNAHERLLALAVEGVANRPQPRELTGRSEEMLLNAAYLVPEHDDALDREVEQLAAAAAPYGVTFELTGPWPAYNFALEEDA
jgi:hypothetical protein